MKKRNDCFTGIGSCVLAGVLLVLLCAMAGCSDLRDMTLSDSGALIDGETGITYIGAPVCFEPVQLAVEPFAECRRLGTKLYAIEGQPSEVWIAEWFADDISGLYYAKGTALPTLEEFGANHLIICMEGTRTVGIGVVEDRTDIDAIVDAYVSGEECPIVQDGTFYQLAFSSDQYEGIYYTVIYVEGSDGKNYIYDRSVQRCVEVGDVLTKYMNRETGAAS